MAPSRDDDGPDGDVTGTEKWVEEVATYFMQQSGWPPIMGRALAWLMVSDPPEQNAAQIATGINASRASLTGTLRLLSESRMVQAVTRSGDRSTYYRVAPDAWATMVRRRLESIASFVDITETGLDLFPDGAAQADRLREAHQVFEWLNAEAEPMLKRWNADRNSRPAHENNKRRGGEQGD